VWNKKQFTNIYRVLLPLVLLFILGCGNKKKQGSIVARVG